MVEPPLDESAEIVPYASAYGVDNVRLQEALRNAAAMVLDQLVEGRTQLLDRGYPFEDTWLEGLLPAAFASLYDYRFLGRFEISLILVGWKLGQPDPHPLSCVAEELALWAISETAIEWLRAREEPVPEGALEALHHFAYEDMDFEVLFDIKQPVETELVDIDGQLGVGHLSFNEWFKPFGGGVSRGVPHPWLWPPEPDEQEGDSG